MQTTSTTNRLTLFDYLDKDNSSAAALQSVVDMSKSSPLEAAQTVEDSLTDVQSIDALVDKINAGDSKVSQSTIADMLEFYFKQVSDEVADKAEDLGLESVPPIAMEDGKWQLVADDEPTDKQQALLDYLNRDTRLSERLERVSSLSQLNELSLSQQFARNLQEGDASEDEVTDFLFSTRDEILAGKVLGIDNGQLTLGNVGIAQGAYDKLSDTKDSE